MSGSVPPPVSPIAAPPWSRARRYGGYAAGILALGGLFWLTSTPPQPPEVAPKPIAPEVPGQVGAPFEPVKPPIQRASLPMPSPTGSGLAPVQEMVASRQTYRPAPLMAFGDARSPAGAETVAGDPGARPGAAGAGVDPLAARLQAEDQPTAVATRLADRNLMLTEGTPIACIPDSPITSDVEGAFRCKVPEAVYSTSGAVPLLDSGTWIVGRVGAGLRRGQRRLFAVMTRVETPQGCLIRIRAPAADALGQAGLDGEIDTHFFQRFGAYIGMAFLESGMQAATLAASSSIGRGGVQFNQFQNAGRQGGQSLFAEDAAIPPTLYRNQGEPIVVRLTQDVDMRPCFRLRTR